MKLVLFSHTSLLVTITGFALASHMCGVGAGIAGVTANNSESSSPPGSFRRGGKGATLKAFFKDAYIPKGLYNYELSKLANNLSDSCSRDVRKFGEQIVSLLGKNGTMEIDNWALQMLDAWGKIPEGILSGHVNSLGDFDSCLGIRGPDPQELFQGKYCLIYVVPNLTQHGASTNIRGISGNRSIENLLKILSIVGSSEMPWVPSLGTCLPSTCTDQEIVHIVKNVLATFHLSPVQSSCRIEEPIKLAPGAIATISLVGTLVLCVILGTGVDLMSRHYDKLRSYKDTLWFRICISFSLPSNGKKLLDTKTSSNDISCLHGIRFLSASWVVIGHTYLVAGIPPLWNAVDVFTLITTNIPFMVILNAPLVVDVFFVMAGFLVSLTLLGMLEKSKGKLNIPLLYLHRYLRITPLYAVIILVGTFVFPLLGSGPYWHVADLWASYCKKNWWKNVLYINNLPIYNTLTDPQDAPCHGISWYLGVDMQLFLISPFLLYPVWKWKAYGVAPLGVVTIVAVIGPGVITYVNNYAPMSLPFKKPQDQFSQKAYTPTYMRATPYFIGMLTGIFFRGMRTPSQQTASYYTPKRNILLVVGAWLVAFCVGFTVLFSPQKFYNPNYSFKPLESAIFVSGQRFAWASAMSWLIFACGTGNGGWINGFLSWKPFVPLGRLTFAIYLVSMYVQFLFHLQARQPTYVTNYHMINLSIAHLVMSSIVAVVCTLLIEAPFMQLLKLLLPTGVRTTTASQKPEAEDKNSAESLAGNEHNIPNFNIRAAESQIVLLAATEPYYAISSPTQIRV